MSKTILISIACLGSLGLGGCAQDEPRRVEAVEAAIAERSRAFETCFANRDASCLVDAYYASDEQNPTVLPPGGRRPVSGRNAIVELFEREFETVQSIHLETIEVLAVDTLAHEFGRAHLTLANGGTAIGRYAVLWVRSSDGWRAKVDFFASDGWSNDR